jgi:hypothetical protein
MSLVDTKTHNLHASLRIRKILVITNKMFFIPRVLFHSLVVLEILKINLTETVEIGYVCHLTIEQLGH